jgi:hypothetical protein
MDVYKIFLAILLGFALLNYFVIPSATTKWNANKSLAKPGIGPAILAIQDLSYLGYAAQQRLRIAKVAGLMLSGSTIGGSAKRKLMPAGRKHDVH